MALIQCAECGKSISDKATACPGCGCPVNVAGSVGVDYQKYTKEELWHKAYNLHYKGKKSDLAVAMEIYQFLINNFTDSTEADYAKSQLKNITPCPSASLSTGSEVYGSPLSPSQLNRFEIMSADKILAEAERFNSKSDIDATGKEVQLYNLVILKYPCSEEAERAKAALGKLGVSVDSTPKTGTSYTSVTFANHDSRDNQRSTNDENISIIGVLPISLISGVVVAFLLGKLASNEPTNGIMTLLGGGLFLYNVIAFFYTKANYRTRFLSAWMLGVVGSNIGGVIGFVLVISTL